MKCSKNDPFPLDLTREILQAFDGMGGTKVLQVGWHQESDDDCPIIEIERLIRTEGLYKSVYTDSILPAVEWYRINLIASGKDKDDADEEAEFERSIPGEFSNLVPLARRFTPDLMRMAISERLLKEKRRQLDLWEIELDQVKHCLDNDLVELAKEIRNLSFSTDPEDLFINHLSVDRWHLEGTDEYGDWKDPCHVAKIVAEIITSQNFTLLDPGSKRAYISDDGYDYMNIIMAMNGHVMIGTQQLLSEDHDMTFDGHQLRMQDGQSLRNMPESLKIASIGRPLKDLIDVGDPVLNERKILGFEDFDPKDEESEVIITLESDLVRYNDVMPNPSTSHH